MSSILSSILGQAGSAGHGLPPDIQAAIGGGQQGSEHQAVPLLKQAISLLHQYQQVEPDEADKQTVMKCLAQLQSVLVKDQQEADGAMQGQTTPRMVRKAAAAQGAGNGGY